MPQMSPFTLELQLVSAILLLSIVVVALACYILPIIVRQLLARTYMSI